MPSSHRVQLPSGRLVAVLKTFVAALLPPATQGAGPGSGLFPLRADTAVLSRSSGSNWGKSVAPWACPCRHRWYIALAEDGGYGKSCQSRPSTQLSGSEVPSPGPVEFPRSNWKIPREGRKAADNDCLPNMQVLTSYSSIQPPWPGFFLFPWSIRGSCVLPPGSDPGQLQLPSCPGA